ncbi:M16 family metallopeptidase [Methylobacterium sp. J-070]|uniref:M16 family metallopeptidase n=1 Tax=Methylobacterium sp. J-070 TaxID=2836650 RepID=UPI001FBBB689|nr:pitrilysin family protein [Methylobacterium sp. J-070]MCJ2054202.1 insulinase family protein [Methylobacterium sp. J-070]
MSLRPPSPAPSTYAERIRTLRSPGGIAAWLIEDQTRPVLTCAFDFRGGARLDPKDAAGTTRMLGALLTEGAGELDGTAFHEALGDGAIRLGTSVGLDGLQGSLRCLVRTAADAFTLLGLALREPTLAPDAVEQARVAITAQIRSAGGRPEELARQAFMARGFRGHAYARPVPGDLASVARIGEADLRAVQARLLTRDNLHIAVVGAITADALGPLLDRAFADLPGGAAPPVARTDLGGLGEQVRTDHAAPQSAIVFGRPALPRDDPDFAAAIVANHCFGGGGLTSRLFRELREKSGLCYAVGTSVAPFRGASTLIGSTRTGTDRVPEMIDRLQGEIRRLTGTGLEAAEFEAAKSYLIGSHDMGLASSSALVGALLMLQVEARQPGWLDAWPAMIAAVGAAEVDRAIGRVFGDGALLVSVAGP